jgi:hypothetical protein
MTVATTEGTKLELLQAREAELAIAVEDARIRIAAYPEQLHEARSRAIYAKPNVRPGAELNSEVSKLNAKEKKDLDGLRALEADLSACRGVLAIEAQRVTEEATAEARAQLAKLHDQEEAVWADAGKLLGELSTVWNSYVAQVEQSHQFASANGLESSDARAVIPGPGSFKEFLALLLTAATEEAVRSEPHTEEIVDYGIYGRRDENGADLGGAMYETRVVGTRTVDTRRRLDERDILFRAIPDLRSAVRTPKG